MDNNSNQGNTKETLYVREKIIKAPIDIIVPAHDNLDLTINCVRFIYMYTQLPFHLIVIDDSTDLTPQYFAEFIKGHDNCTYIHSDVPYKEGNQIFNIGLANCKYDFVATVMNSVTVQPDWETLAVEVLRCDPRIATVGLKCLFPWGTIESAGIELRAAREYGGIEVAGIYPVDIGVNLPAHLLCNSFERQAVQWAFAMHRVSALRGNLEEGVFHAFLGWDDIDNCFVLRKKGYKILYCGNGAGYHISRITRGIQDDDVEGLKKNHENALLFRKRWELEVARKEEMVGVSNG